MQWSKAKLIPQRRIKVLNVLNDLKDFKDIIPFQRERLLFHEFVNPLFDDIVLLVRAASAEVAVIDAVEFHDRHMVRHVYFFS